MRIRKAHRVIVGAISCVTVLAWSSVGLASPGTQACEENGPCNTATSSTRHLTTYQRVDLAPAAASDCDFPGSDPAVVDEMSVALDPVVTVVQTFGPATIYIGEDEHQEFFVEPGSVNVNTRTTYETVVTQYFQAVEPGPPCAVVLGISFTG